MKEELLARLRPYQQEHLLAFWHELDEMQRSALASQIENIDLAKIAEMHQQCTSEKNHSSDALDANPPNAVRLGDGADVEIEAERVGLEALAAGTVAVALVAGGQGSRLGFDHPKGMYPIGPISGDSLFNILLGKVVATGQLADSQIPVYLMTSPATHEETKEYLEQSKNFGIPSEDVMLFCQGTFPAVDAVTGKLLLASKDSLFLSPDGHGGMLAALARSGALKNMKQRGIKHLFYFQVDNPLATVCDPVLIGHHILASSEYTLQVVAKQQPKDKVGNVVEVGGKTRIIEYSDLPSEAANLRNEDGSLKLWAGSIAVHIFDVDFLVRMTQGENALPVHLARKKVPFVDSDGERRDPEDANAIKFEQFIFDLLPYAAEAITVEVDPAKAFGPLKNGAGATTDTAEHVQQQLMHFHRCMLREAGFQITDSTRVEINPRFAMTAESLKRKISAGTVVKNETYFH